MKWYWWLAIGALVVIALFFWGKNEYEVKTVYETKRIMDQKPQSNMPAFLKVIRFAEGTAGVNGYRTRYGGKLFNNITDHPTLTGEWMGEVLPDRFCTSAGLKPGCKSTAAGAYQITVTTWKRLKRKLSLTDFSPASQDLAAIELIREKGALNDVTSGKFLTAIDKVQGIWASLPDIPGGAGAVDYNQPEKKVADLIAMYKQNGGTLTA